ncbi:uncharacterized protein [Dendrobates tinctorius]|uniref:uncharacterized protein isoform X1 n=1 Tax=Dendrobates tinctorius TaxID=92724 RepID=UPI003CC9A23D
MGMTSPQPPIIKTPKTQIPSHHPDFSPNDEPDMDEDESNISRRIIDFTSEIISLLSGEDYTIEKKTSGDCVTPIIHLHVSGGGSSNESPITEAPHSPMPEKKILDLTTEITELLTGEVRVRCQDAAVYFSMEEWEYMEGQKDQDQDVRRKNDPTRIDQDKSNMTARVLLLALEIIDLLKGKVRVSHEITLISINRTGLKRWIESVVIGVCHCTQEHTVVKKTSGDRVTPCMSGGRSKIQSPITEPLHCPTPEKKVLDLANKITELLTGEVPVRCQDAAVYFSMEEWEYMEGQKDQDQDVRRKNDPTRIDQDKSNMTARVLLLALEIIDLLKGMEHTVVKKTSGDRVTPCMSGGRSKIQSPITEPLHCPTPEKKVLELANKITELLTGEVPLRCQDVALYFSMEEWDYVEGHWDQYKNVVVEELRPLVSPENASGRSGENVMLSLEYNVKEEDIMCQSSGENLITLNVHREHLVKHKRSHTREKPYSCSECGKCFSQKSNLVNHERIHKGKRPFSCSECGKYFISKSDLVRHERIHTGEKPYSCSECGKCFSLKVILINHERIHTGVKTFSCSECGKCFIGKSDLVNHERIHTGEKPYLCSECGKCFSRKNLLTKHKRIHTVETPFSCSECGKYFKYKSCLHKHERIHKGKMMFSCSECGKCFILKSYLVAHQSIHNGEKPYSCSVCQKHFAHKSHLNIHEKIHTGVKPYACSECGKCFRWKSGLNKHKSVHTGEKPYSCSECGKCFAAKSSLTVHERIHTGERPYTCSVCQKDFINKSSLTVHERGHTGEKPYSCSECGKNFMHRSSLITHVKTHTEEKPYSCSECGKCFNTEALLNSHQKDHTGENPVTCSECGISFIYESSLLRHKKIHVQSVENVSLNESFQVKHQRSYTVEKPYSCSECGKCFKTEALLSSHQRDHTGENPVTCSECGICFIYESSLLRHKKIHDVHNVSLNRSFQVKQQRSYTVEKPYSCSECGKCFISKDKLHSHQRSHTQGGAV